MKWLDFRCKTQFRHPAAGCELSEQELFERSRVIHSTPHDDRSIEQTDNRTLGGFLDTFLLCFELLLLLLLLLKIHVLTLSHAQVCILCLHLS